MAHIRTDQFGQVNALLADPILKAKFTDLGGTILSGSPADFAKLIAEETEKWAKVVKHSSMQVEVEPGTGPAPLSEPWTFNLHVRYCLMTLAI